MKAERIHDQLLRILKNLINAPHKMAQKVESIPVFLHIGTTSNHCEDVCVNGEKSFAQSLLNSFQAVLSPERLSCR